MEKMPSVTPGERRKFMRCATILPVKYSKALKSEGEDYQTALKKNIAEGGIKVEVKEKIKVGSILALRIDLPTLEGEDIIFTTGQVIWSQKRDEKYEVGISFLNIDDIDLQKISKFLKRRERHEN